MAFLEIKKIAKKFENQTILDHCSFDVQEGETLALLGRSGSGKTTLLKILAGLETADSGAVVAEKKDMQNVSPQQRNMLYLYQEALLFPHLNVFENIAFGLRLKKLDKQEITQKTEEMLLHLGIADHAKKMPNQISGGQKQRVAFGRAIIIQPKVLLLDEPFGALDSETRSEMQDFFKKITSDFKITSVFVTHDLKEALIVGDCFAFIKQGKLQNYSDKTAFLADEATGFGAELDFWRGVV